jgi:hypothetical protein
MPGMGGAPAVASKPYSTLSSRLRGVLDRLDDKQGVVLTLALDAAVASEQIARQVPDAAGAGIEAVGVSMNTNAGLGGSIVLECKNGEGAKKIDTGVRAVLPLAMAWLTEQKFAVDWQQNPSNQPGMMPRPAPGANPAIMPNMPMPKAGGPMPPAMPNMPMPNMPRPGVNPPAAGAQPEKKEDDPNVLAITLEGPRVNDRYIQFSAKMNSTALTVLSLKYVSPLIQQARGENDMAQKNPNPYDLAGAARKYADERKSYPRGTLELPLSAERAGRPWVPNEQVSWMADMLPYLGYQEVHRAIDEKAPWTDQRNLGAARALIPYFVNPSYPVGSRYVPHPLLGVGVAATHYVGLGGIGLDAASYAKDDPAAAGKLGVFGYNRSTPLAEVGDHTIVMIQVPPPPVGAVGPWIEGGGSTIRGVPEKNSIAPFVSIEYNGKRGTYALMGDGSVRFIAADIADEVFKKLAVVSKEKVPNLDTLAPVVPPPEKKVAERAN